MNHDDDPKLILDDNEWRCYKRATRNLRHRQRMERGKGTNPESSLPQGRTREKLAPLAWLQAVDWDDDGDPVLVFSETFPVLPVELVA